MSPSSFHQHFKSITSLSPLQFQKQLRLIEARRLMLSEEYSPGIAAFSVGYESVTQFTREYARMFGLPPVRETQTSTERFRAGSESSLIGDGNRSIRRAKPCR
jgi:AraC-like DNA-binding protein